jgi:hypothetical protein
MNLDASSPTNLDASELTKVFSSDLFRGVLINYAPRILKGAMKEYLGAIPFDKMIDWINRDQNLWETLPPGLQATFIDFGPRFGDMGWFTVEWVIETGTETSPSLASLYSGWPEAHNWLEKQIEDIKTHMKGDNNGR